MVVLLARDLGFHPIVRLLSDKKVISNLLLTNSSYLDQEIWMIGLQDRSFQTHMIWYSTNTRSMDYKESKIKGEHPAYSVMKVDTSWVWCKDHGDWVVESTQCKDVRVCGPILYFDPKQAELSNRQNIDVLIFDVTPVVDSWMNDNFTNKVYYFFQNANVTKFVNDILSIGRLDEYKFAIKHKRDHSWLHDKRYIDFIAEKEKLGLELVSPLENVFELVSRAKVTVVTPFSSPAYVAAFLDRPVIYYDPVGVLVPPAWLPESIQFVNSPDELRKKLLQIVDKSKLSTESQPLS